jgi:5'-deoxynucleotidase YfbR-like HD superfamily hydrolase
MNGDWIQMLSGARVGFTNPNPDEILIGDIAHSLAGQPRFNRNTWTNYSVGQHSILVASLLPFGLQLWGLLHDAGESVTGDIPYPIKQTIKEYCPEFSYFEQNLQSVIYEKYGLKGEEPEELREIDRRMALTEGRQLHGNTEGWYEDGIYESYNFNIIPWDEFVVKDMFLYYFHILHDKHSGWRSGIAHPDKLNELAKDPYFFRDTVRDRFWV